MWGKAKEQKPQTVPVGGFLPTRKWWAARIVAGGTLLTLFIQTDSWDKEEWIMLVGLITEAAVSYLLPNDKTVGGAPQA